MPILDKKPPLNIAIYKTTTKELSKENSSVYAMGTNDGSELLDTEEGITIILSPKLIENNNIFIYVLFIYTHG